MQALILSVLCFALLPGSQLQDKNTRPLRATRWSIVLPQNNPEAFLKKLRDIQAFLLLPDGDSATTFLLCDNLTKTPMEFRRIDKPGVNALNRLWFISHDSTGRDQLNIALKLSAPPKWFAMFIPAELEAQMVKQEVQYQGKSEEELFTHQWITVFDITRTGDVWQVKVTYQGPKQK